MATIESALARFRQEPLVKQSENPFELVSTISAPASPLEVERAWAGAAVPPEAASMWSACREARLCEDAEFGQWGLVILDPQGSVRKTREAQAARPSEFRDDDVVVGKFLGDQEALVIAPSETGCRRILVALPLDRRSDWFGVAEDLARFLDAYFCAGGDKYWERPHV